MTVTMNEEYFDIVICGCGPTGALLSANLSRLGIRHLVLEREDSITTDPRGIALDEDGIRIVQGVGKYEQLFTDVGKAMGMFRFIDGGRGLHVKPFLQINNNTITGGTGHVGFMSHKQPELEKHLRDAMDKKYAELRGGSTLTKVSEDDENVHVTYQTADAKIHRIRAKFLVGADGKTGFVRKNYLEAKGVLMEKTSKFQYEAVWVALNWHLTLPTPKTHPEFPLWNLGYSPEEVYDLFFPRDFNFICDPSRPAVCGRFGRTEDRLWRFEFVVKTDEDAETMATTAETRKIIFPYLKQPGKRFGLSQDLMWPIDCIKCIRSRPFSFSARSCNRWSLGRTILCGDAAHVFPPFGGQGIASGFRDAISLSWRLYLALFPSCTDYDVLFRGWYTERKQQLEWSLASTIQNGNYCNEPSKFKAFLRNWYLWSVQLVPSWRYDLELGSRAAGMTKYLYSPGVPFLPKYGGGVSFPQVFAAPIDGPAPSLPMFTDDEIFAKSKSGIFQAVALVDSIKELQDARQQIASISASHGVGQLVDLAETTYIVHSQRRQTPQASSISKLKHVIRVIDAEEYKAAGETEDALARNFPRPPPLHYDPQRIRKDLGNNILYVIVRWDRIVFASCQDLKELTDTLSMVAGTLAGESSV